jgi:hypothetical protein
MNSIRMRAAGVAALIFLTMPHPSMAAVEPGVEYPAGTKIDTPGTGVEFTIPAGWSGILPKGGTFFVLGSPEQQAYIFVMVENKTIEEAQGMLAQPLPLGNGLMLQPTSDIQRQGKTLFASYEVTGTDEPMTGYIQTWIGDGGLGVSYIAISAPDTATAVQDVLHKLSEETVLEQP